MYTSKLMLNMHEGGVTTHGVKKAITADVTAAQHIHMLPQSLLSLRSMTDTPTPPYRHKADASCTYGLSLVWSHSCTCYNEARVMPFIQAHTHTHTHAHTHTHTQDCKMRGIPSARGCHILAWLHQCTCWKRASLVSHSKWNSSDLSSALVRSKVVYFQRLNHLDVKMRGVWCSKLYWIGKTGTDVWYAFHIRTNVRGSVRHQCVRSGQKSNSKLKTNCGQQPTRVNANC